MHKPLDYYGILGVGRDATEEQIKSRFRVLAKQLHPDTGDGSEESRIRFILVRNAWNVLSDPGRRSEYDAYLAHSRVFRSADNDNKLKLAGKRGFVYKADDQIYDFLNFIFWEIEDYISSLSRQDLERKAGEFTVRHYLMRILVFFDKWLLTPAGFPDYFMSARKMENIDPEVYLALQDGSSAAGRHQPYADLNDYFYALRKRLNSFLEKFSIRQLAEPVTEHKIRLIDCIIECQNFALHYLSGLMACRSDAGKRMTLFGYSNPVFTLIIDKNES